MKRSATKGANKGKGLSQKEREELMIENFVSLQKVMTNLSIKFEKLSENISQLLEVFETAARNLASGKEPELEKKLNILLDQNKTIARSLISLQENMPRNQRTFSRPKPFPR